MSTILFEDTARNNLASRTCEGVQAGTAAGAVLNPFCSLYVARTNKPSAHQHRATIQKAGGIVWFDAMTHALQLPTTGDYRCYDQWNLWDERARGQLSTRAMRRDHILRVFGCQRELDVPLLAPTTLMRSTATADIALSIAMLEDAMDLNTPCGASLSGTPNFWCSGGSLDAVIGSIAQFEPTYWFLSVARPTSDFPVAASADEVAGVCRTVKSLSLIAPVHLSLADTAAFPALVAGASTFGTGWDKRQRVLAADAYEAREAGSFGSWFQRPTVKGLFAYPSRAEVERLFRQDASFAAGVFEGALHPDQPRECWEHHLACLDDIAVAIAGGGEPAFRALVDMYDDALRNWTRYATLVGVPDASRQWVQPHLDGLRLFADNEGWRS